MNVVEFLLPLQLMQIYAPKVVDVIPCVFVGSHVTCCGGINPYTLTARLGPAWIRGSGPLEDDAWLGQLGRSPAQGVNADLEIKQDPGRLE